MQKLLMPYSHCQVLAGFMVESYKKEWGYHHLGVDLTSVAHPDITMRKKVFASGVGKVIKTGLDNRVGNVVVIVYPDVVYHNGETASLTGRYYHLDKVMVKEGDKIYSDTIIAVEGNTGTGGIHLHMELDPDTKYPLYSTQVAGGNIIKKGTTPPLDPMKVLYCRHGGAIIPSPFGIGWNNAHDSKLPIAISNGEQCALLEGKLQRIEEILREEW